MKKQLFLGLAILVFSSAMARIDTIIPKSKITDVTVFFSGAQIKQSAEIKINKGKTIILFDNLPRDINEKSIQVQSINNCKILSVKHQILDEQSRNKSPQELDIENKIEAQNLKVKELKNKLDVFEIEEKLLTDNSLLSKKNTGTTIAQIKEAADYYRLKFNEIRQNKLNVVTEANKIVSANKALYAQLNAITSKKRLAYSQVLVAIEAENNINTTMQFNYYLASAAWNPQYDFRVDKVTQPLSIVYNAIIFQSTGEDWDNVNLKLSTTNPSLTSEKPDLETWYVGGGYHPSYAKVSYSKQVDANMLNFGALKISLKDASTNEPIAFGTVIVSDDNGGQAGVGQTDIDGNVTIKPLANGKYQVKALYTGFTTKMVNNVYVQSGRTAYTNIDMEGGIELGEVMVAAYNQPLLDSDTKSGGTIIREEYSNLSSKSSLNSVSSKVAGTNLNIRGGRSSSVSYYYDDNASTIQNLKKEMNEIKPNLEYAIEIPYSILSDGKDNLVKIKETPIAAEYVYYAAPKLDKEVFVQASIIDWQKLNLLSGKSSVYLNGTFTGESEIDADQISDTLQLSLGREKNILVQRERNRLIKDKRSAGSNIKETFAWDITVKNNNAQKVKLILEDQIPVSERTSIQIELLEMANAVKHEKTGKLTWELSLEPNEKKVISYKYSIKYPKSSGIDLE
jgi:Domain of unknown function (DUF4139)/N-terminal domain of unknown function (DUF4140)